MVRGMTVHANTAADWTLEEVEEARRFIEVAIPSAKFGSTDYGYALAAMVKLPNGERVAAKVFDPFYGVRYPPEDVVAYLLGRMNPQK